MLSAAVLLAALFLVGTAAAQNPPPVPQADRVLWDRNPDSDQVTGYKLYTRLPAQQQGTYTYTLWTTVPQTAPGVTPQVLFSQNPLPPGIQTVVATAYNSAGESGYSNAVTFYVLVIPGVPQNLRAGTP